MIQIKLENSGGVWKQINEITKSKLIYGTPGGFPDESLIEQLAKVLGDDKFVNDMRYRAVDTVYNAIDDLLKEAESKFKKI